MVIRVEALDSNFWYSVDEYYAYCDYKEFDDREYKETIKDYEMESGAEDCL